MGRDYRTRDAKRMRREEKNEKMREDDLPVRRGRVVVAGVVEGVSVVVSDGNRPITRPPCNIVPCQSTLDLLPLVQLFPQICLLSRLNSCERCGPDRWTPFDLCQRAIADLLPTACSMNGRKDTWWKAYLSISEAGVSGISGDAVDTSADGESVEAFVAHTLLAVAARVKQALLTVGAVAS